MTRREQKVAVNIIVGVERECVEEIGAATVEKSCIHGNPYPGPMVTMADPSTFNDELTPFTV